MRHIRTTSGGENIKRVTVNNGKATYRLIFKNGQRSFAEKELQEGDYRGLETTTHRAVKGPESVWVFAEECLTKESITLPLIEPRGSDKLGEPYCVDSDDLPLAGLNGNAIEGDLVVFITDGEVSWNQDDPEEPTYKVKAGEQMWLNNFKESEDGRYTHEYHYRSGAVTIKTTAKIACIYQSFGAQDDIPLQDRPRIDITPDYR
ncbi:hypothetical protein [Vibrio mediterranei]|uniref:hypothetical protein n=1 Tax=Vibrio mediterranei TaxID=689 RepID=UPI004068469D